MEEKRDMSENFLPGPSSAITPPFETNPQVATYEPPKPTSNAQPNSETTEMRQLASRTFGRLGKNEGTLKPTDPYELWTRVSKHCGMRLHAKNQIKVPRWGVKHSSEWSNLPSDQLENDFFVDRSIVETHFDLDRTRVETLFQNFDLNRSSSINEKEFVEGLRGFGIVGDVTLLANCLQLLSQEMDQTDKITLKQFRVFMQMTRLAMLFDNTVRLQIADQIYSANTKFVVDEQYVPVCQMTCIDYNAEKVFVHTDCEDVSEAKPWKLDSETAKEFFFRTEKSRPDCVRWNCYEQPDPVSILAMSMHYQLPQHVIEDVLELKSQLAKFDVYGRNFVAILPVVRVSTYAQEVMKDKNIIDSCRTNSNAWQLWEAKDHLSPSRILETQNLCVMLCDRHGWGVHNQEGVVSVESGFAPLTLFSGKPSPKKAKPPTHDYLRPSSCMFHGIWNNLNIDFSVLRTRGAGFLFYSIIDAAVDSFGPVVSQFKFRLDWYAYHLRTQRSRFSDRVDGLVDTHREIELCLDSARAVSNVLSQFKNHAEQFETGRLANRKKRNASRSEHMSTLSINDTLDDEIERSLIAFINDAQDHIDIVIRTLEQMENLSDCYRAEYTQFRDDRMSNILYWLTLVTIVILPFQTFSGIFGMNFADDQGTQYSPFLKWKYGLTVFWVANIVLTIVIGGFLLWCSPVCNNKRCCARGTPQDRGIQALASKRSYQELNQYFPRSS